MIRKSKPKKKNIEKLKIFLKRKKIKSNGKRNIL